MEPIPNHVNQHEDDRTTAMLCTNCRHDLSEHSPKSDDVASHSCDVCDCKGFQAPEADVT